MLLLYVVVYYNDILMFFFGMGVIGIDLNIGDNYMMLFYEVVMGNNVLVGLMLCEVCVDINFGYGVWGGIFL